MTDEEMVDKLLLAVEGQKAAYTLCVTKCADTTIIRLVSNFLDKGVKITTMLVRHDDPHFILPFGGLVDTGYTRIQCDQICRNIYVTNRCNLLAHSY